jgi:4-hydroxybenzoate polyprenyltransferase
VLIPIIVFASFSYLINLMRELIKDIEDMDGDARYGSKSMPLTLGVEQTKFMVNFHGVLLCLLFIAWQLIRTASILVWAISIFCILFPVIHLMYKLSKAKAKQDYSFLSRWCKYIMFIGMLYCMFINRV